jgi:hypothetical protein
VSVSELWRSLVCFLRRDRLSVELREEMQLHLELRERQLREAGVEPADASHLARRGFGNTTVLAERSRERWGWGGWSRLSRTFATRDGDCAGAPG